MIDHTLLNPSATREQIDRLCQEARAYNVHAVCVNSSWVLLAVNALRGTEVKVASTVGFPLGASLSEVKAFEAKTAVDLGATEVDMVMNIGALKSQDLATVRDDIEQVVNACKSAPVKVIRGRVPDRSRENSGVQTRRGSRRSLRENINWIQLKRGHSC